MLMVNMPLQPAKASRNTATSLRNGSHGTSPQVSTPTLKGSTSDCPHSHLFVRTIQACQLAKDAAGAAAEGIATGSRALLSSLLQREKELDELDMEIDAGVTQAITQVSATEARELLACMKVMIGL